MPEFPLQQIVAAVAAHVIVAAAAVESVGRGPAAHAVGPRAADPKHRSVFGEGVAALADRGELRAELHRAVAVGHRDPAGHGQVGGAEGHADAVGGTARERQPVAGLDVERLFGGDGLEGVGRHLKPLKNEIPLGRHELGRNDGR
ncbi:hypothetical protein [Phenylobacterium sp. J367]|uniref:hypothetical protein n=1 Tax=Phenylobacterium sp. J367 TaxID=2898435 RepID=UPI0021508F7A|nr:hypothetical protein [Phenylobacterium sp. J367]MCR5880970.1 hypothetical protein [Phenylobacterium sp. J367]